MKDKNKKLEQLYNALTTNNLDIATRLLEDKDAVQSLIANNMLCDCLQLALENKFADIAMRMLENKDAVQSLIANNMLCDCLQLALENKFADIAMRMLENKDAVQSLIANNMLCDCLQLAVKNKFPDIAMRMLEHKDAVQSLIANNMLCDCLQLAVKNKFPDIAMRMLEHKDAVQSLIATNRLYPLIVALENKFPDIAMRMLEHKNAVQSLIETNMLYYSLILALDNKFPDIAMRMLEHKDAVQSLIATNKLHYVLPSTLENKFPDIAMRMLEHKDAVQSLLANNMLYYPLQLAVKNKFPDIAMRMLEHKDVVQSLIATNKLHYLLPSTLENKFADIAMRMLENKDAVQSLIANNMLYYPLQLALENKFADIAMRMLENKDAVQSLIATNKLHYLLILALENKFADIAMRMLENKDAVQSLIATNKLAWVLEAAFRNKFPDVVEFLIRNGADVNVEDSHGRTPLHYAIAYNNADMFEFLIKNGADVNVKYKGLTLLQYSVMGGNETILKLVLANKPTFVKTKDADGKNIGCYCKRNAFTILTSLADHGLDLHELDNFGNSVLYHALENYRQDDEGHADPGCIPKRTKELKPEEKNALMKLLDNQKIKCYRDNIEVKTHLHIRVAAKLPLMLDSLATTERMLLINQQDFNEKKTPLHYAIILGNTDAAIELIKFGTNINIRDKAGKTPLEYAKLTNNAIVVDAIKNTLNQKSLLLFKNTHSVVDAIKNTLNQKSLLLFKNTHSVKENYANKAIDKEYVQTNILLNILKNSVALPDGCAYGVELELSNIPPGVTEEVLSVFGINVTKDGSVTHPLFMSTGNLNGEELVTGILGSTYKIRLLLEAAGYLLKAGALTNTSAGLHVHMNVIGGKDGFPKSVVANMHTKNLDKEQVELMIVKQILANWYNLEPLLCGIMRNGNLYNYGKETDSYNAPMQNFIPQLLKMNSLSELPHLMAREVTLNLLNLSPNKHGTIEFRIHEGTIDPILIQAWLDFIHRLNQISIMQVQEKIDTGKDLDTFTAYKDIEQLFYMLMAERCYQTTWDNTLKSPRGTSIPATAGDKPIQVAIQNSLLYRAYQLGKEGKDYKYLLANRPEEEQGDIIRDVKAMLEINRQFPGLLAPTMANAKEKLKAKL